MCEVPRFSRSLRAFTNLDRKKKQINDEPNDLEKKRLRQAAIQNK